MKNTFGSSLALTLFGESHGEYIGAVLDGIAPGIRIERGYIEKMLARRRPTGDISTSRREADEFIFASGVSGGYTTGTPLCILIPNTNTKSADYEKLADTPRPSHADFAAGCKYHGFEDRRGGGHFSGRVTAAIVAAGAIVRMALEERGIFIGTHVLRIRNVCDRSFANMTEDIKALALSDFPTLDGECAERMKEEILLAKEAHDSVGGILETAVIGMPAGVGEPWFDTVEGTLSHALFSIPAVKGVEFGCGFGFAHGTGSELNDAFAVVDGEIVTKTNNNGGINGGITNGMPIVFRCALKPTPSIARKQETVSLSRMENVTLEICGRHDPCIVHRAAAVVDAVTALALADALVVRFGTDYLAKKG